MKEGEYVSIMSGRPIRRSALNPEMPGKPWTWMSHNMYKLRNANAATGMGLEILRTKECSAFSKRNPFCG